MDQNEEEKGHVSIDIPVKLFARFFRRDDEDFDRANLVIRADDGRQWALFGMVGELDMDVDIVLSELVDDHEEKNRTRE